MRPAVAQRLLHTGEYRLGVRQRAQVVKTRKPGAGKLQRRHHRAEAEHALLILNHRAVGQGRAMAIRLQPGGPPARDKLNVVLREPGYRQRQQLIAIDLPTQKPARQRRAASRTLA